MDLQADTSLMTLDEEGKRHLSSQIMLDSGSDQCIINRFYRHLFLRLNTVMYRRQMSGMGGLETYSVPFLQKLFYGESGLPSYQIRSYLVFTESGPTPIWDQPL